MIEVVLYSKNLVQATEVQDFSFKSQKDLNKMK